MIFRLKKKMVFRLYLVYISMQDLEITIPKVSDEDVVKIPKGVLGDVRGIENKVDQLGGLLLGITASVVVSGIAVMIAVFGIFLDQMRFNNAAYKDYSDRSNVKDILNVVGQQIGNFKQDQQVYFEQQKQIIEELKKNK